MLIQGETCGAIPLNQVGRDQARRAGERVGGERLVAAYSSDFRRASETADIVVAENKFFKSENKTLKVE